jgi:hypothetical protein
MKRIFFCIWLPFFSANAFSQASVGIGTTNPNAKAILDLSSTTQVFLPPRMDTAQMKNISLPPVGSMIFNTSLSTPMTYARMGYRPSIIIGQFIANNRWLPVSPGPKVLAWGVVDSTTGNPNVSSGIIAPLKASSGNFSIRWQGNAQSKNWYELNLHNDEFNRDSMMLMVTPIGNGSWDMTVSIGEIFVTEDVYATIKFTDVSRVATGTWQSLDTRRRSNFYFVLYDLRGY